MIIDAHTHLDHAGEKDWTPEQLIAAMDRAGIDQSIVISNTINNAPIEKMLEFASRQPRFKVVGHINFSSLDNDQIGKIKLYLKNKQIHGVKLYPGYENFYPDDKKLNPLFEYCEANDHPILIHTGIIMAGKSGLLEQAHPLVVDRIASRFPNLKIVIAHFGNPWIMDAAAVVSKNPRVFVDLSGYFTEFTDISPAELKLFIRQLTDFKTFVGSFKKCLFGTDFPLYNQMQYLE